MKLYKLLDVRLVIQPFGIAANVNALAALYAYTGDPLIKPLGKWPDDPNAE